MLSRRSTVLAVALGLLVLPIVGCDSMNRKDASSSDKASCCTDDGKSMDHSKMSKADMDKCGDDMIAKGNAMKTDAMRMPVGPGRDAKMTKAEHMIQEGQECKEKAAKM